MVYRTYDLKNKLEKIYQIIIYLVLFQNKDLEIKEKLKMLLEILIMKEY